MSSSDYGSIEDLLDMVKKQRPLAERRKISTVRTLSAQVFIKEGYLLKQGRSFQRWSRRYFRLADRRLYYAREKTDDIFNELNLIDFSVAERHSKSSFTFQVITPFAVLVLAAENRREMDDWVNALRAVASGQSNEQEQTAREMYSAATSGEHAWYVCSHARPTHCNWCREKLSGVAWHGLSCEVCKMKSHKRCASKIVDTCKWTTGTSVPQELRLPDTPSMMPHQWLEGNLPMGSKCAICDKACGSVLKLQDWRCLWCNTIVHDGCREQLPCACLLGPARLSILPPIALTCLAPDGSAKFDWSALGSELGGGSPLLVLVNSKSGENQGVRMLRKFRRLLNPAQVFDIIATGPDFGLNFFKELDSFRVIVCGGDGTVGWVLSTFDRLNLHSKCQMGVLPLGTGNDLARVLGWGHAFDDDTQLPHLLQTFEIAHTRMLDRWSVMTYEGATQMKKKPSIIQHYEQSVADHLSKILGSDDHSVIISSAKVLCETVKDFLTKVNETYKEVEKWERNAGKLSEESISEKCETLLSKLDSLLKSLHEESSQAADAVEESGIEPEGSSSDSVPEMTHTKGKRFVHREALMDRANSLKKALRQIIEHTERAVDEQNRQTRGNSNTVAKRERFRKKRSKTTPAALNNSGKQSNSNISNASSNTSPPPSPSSLLLERLVPADSRPTGHLSQTSGLGLSPDLHLGLGGLHESSPNSDSLAQNQLRPPSIGNVQPPTPCLTPSTSEPSKSLGEIGSSRSFDENSADGIESLPESSSFLKPASETDLTVALKRCNKTKSRGSGEQRDVKLSYSDSSIYAADQSETSPSAMRKVTKGSSLRIFRDQRGSSPSRGLLPAFKRGLLASGLTGGSLIAEVLLLNADVLGVAASPLMDFDQVPLESYKEAKVMNNYFGIGLDAKIALEFDNKREARADKAKSRAKLMMWYGMLGGKELLHRTYKNLEQRIHLECDGQRMQLPSLQGIVILNIPSYSGGANFWGTTKEDSIFTAQSFDDKVLEVVAVFSVIHVATSRVPSVVRLQNHRIAQCRHVKIIITGNDPIPVQVDGEPWLQPPGFIQIVHKNRAQVLVRNPAFEATLKTWQEQKDRTAPTTPTALVHTVFDDDSGRLEATLFVDSASRFMQTVERDLPEIYPSLNVTLLDAIANANDALKPIRNATTSADEKQTVQAVKAMRNLIDLVKIETKNEERPHNGEKVQTSDSPSRRRFADALHSCIAAVQKIERRLQDIETPTETGDSEQDTVTPSAKSATELRDIELRTENAGQRPHRSKSRFTQWLRSKWKRRRARTASWSEEVANWSIADVSRWLSASNLGQYRETFESHEISGRELIRLERSDLKDLGVVKVGHIKRIQSAIFELVRSTNAPSFDSSRSKPAIRAAERADPNDASVSSL